MAKGIDAADPPLRLRFTAAVFGGSFLLFLVQPMIARMALPRLGGAPAVWNSAMLVYQALLLGGYAYAHWLGRLPPRRQARIHMAAFAVAAITLPIGLVTLDQPAESSPFLWVPGLLLLSVGPLFLVISAQAPLLQRWFATAGGGDPYPLYAASNLGSFGGLLSYPLLVEPFIPLLAQSWLWSAGYCAVALLVAWCTLALPREAVTRLDEAACPAPEWASWCRWAIIAAVPSGLILSTTLLLTTDIMAMPLLWVVPLGAYLLSFTVAFSENGKLVRAIGRIAPLSLLAAVGGGLFVNMPSLLPVVVLLTVLALFTISVALHRRLFESRPHPRHLTSFYLSLSVGGVAGGIFCALVAPLLFDWTYEHLILLTAAAWLLRSRSPFARKVSLWNGDRTARQMTVAGVLVVSLMAVAQALDLLPSRVAIVTILAVGIVAIGNRGLFTASVVALLLAAGGADRLALSAKPGQMMRSFFGVYVIADRGASRTLTHGTTLHGLQNRGSVAREKMATTYYAPKSGVGLALASVDRLFGPAARVGVVGLGAGTLACYRRPEQRWTIYEIDPLVAEIATDAQRFTFLSRCLPDAAIRLGDARVTLERAPRASADVLVIDAFSSDAIPLHLLTAEAFGIYRRHLGKNGLLLIHISNKYLDLEPVLATAAANGRWHAAARFYRPDAREAALNYSTSRWIAMSPAKATLGALLATSPERWEPLRRGGARWTDEHASMLTAIRIGGFR